MMNGLLDLSLCALVSAIKSGKASATEAVKASLDRMERTQELNNFTAITAERALKRAAILDKRIKSGSVGALCGVPVAVKDNINIAGVKTTCCSRAVDFTPRTTADAAAALENADAVIVGKTNMDELAMGSTDESSAFGAVKNALDVTRVAGGSSGGSANAVCAKQVFGALGSDTGGSVRQPAAFCGVVGLKPTAGRISARGLAGCVPSLDAIGILARNSADASAMFDALCYCEELRELPPTELKNVTVGVIKQAEALAEKTEAAAGCAKAVDTLAAAGARIVHVDVPSFSLALAVYHILSSAEAAHTLSDGGNGLVDGHKRDLLGDEVKRRVIAGMYVLGGERYDGLYIKAARLRTRLKREFDGALRGVHALVTPTAPTAAFKLGQSADPHETHSSDMFLSPISLAGLPALSVPCAEAGGMPLGLQIIGRADGERDILSLARAFEIATGADCRACPR